MKTLVVGSSSVVGRAVGVACREFGEVCFAGRHGGDIFFDVADTRVIPQTIKNYDVVIHVASDFGGLEDDDFIRCEHVNSVGTLAVCRLANQAKAKHLILMSSASAGYQEGSPGYGIYSLSKRHGEEVASLYCLERGIDLTILRPTQIYDAAGECRRHQSLFYHIIDLARQGKDVAIYGKNDATRNYLFLDDLVRLCIHVINRKCFGNFYCASFNSITISQFASLAYKVFGKGGETYFLPNEPDIVDVPEVKDFSIYDATGYFPQVDIKDGLCRIRDYAS